jgi:phosphonoacetate hydrolase
MLELGALVAATADHGMNDKTRPDGTPNVIFLQEELAARFGEGAVSVICPITDPYVHRRGALGSFVRVYVNRGDVRAMMDAAAKLRAIDMVLDGKTAARRFELPAASGGSGR